MEIYVPRIREVFGDYNPVRMLGETVDHFISMMRYAQRCAFPVDVWHVADRQGVPLTFVRITDGVTGFELAAYEISPAGMGV